MIDLTFFWTGGERGHAKGKKGKKKGKKIGDIDFFAIRRVCGEEEGGNTLLKIGGAGGVYFIIQDSILHIRILPINLTRKVLSLFFSQKKKSRFFLQQKELSFLQNFFF